MTIEEILAIRSVAYGLNAREWRDYDDLSYRHHGRVGVTHEEYERLRMYREIVRMHDFRRR